MASTLVVDKIKGGTGGVAFTLPTSDGSANQLLKTDGSLTLGWATDAGIASLAADTSPQLGGDLDCNSSQIQWSQGADVASATALAVLTDGNYFDVTGTTTITSINTTGGVGTQIKLHFDGALTLTHDATDLFLPGGANITTAAGDEAEFIEYATGKYRCTNYSKANGKPVSSSSTLGGALDGADYTVSKINLKDYGEVTNALGSAGGARTIDLTLGNSVTATASASTNTWTFSNPTASDELCGFTLMLTNGGSQTMTWPASVDWAGGSAPDLTSSGVDCLVFWTVDGGTIWNGGLVGADLS